MMKKAVAEAVDRHGYDPTKPAILESDASHYAGGCVIKQKNTKEEVVLLYDSFCLTPTERRYGLLSKRALRPARQKSTA